jgi:hypothetical protein
MNSTTLTAAAAAERTRDLRGAATNARLAALARCCKPSYWRAALRSAATRFATARAGRASTVACVAC